MWSFKGDEVLLSFLKLEGFKEKPFKIKIQWLIRYIPVLVMCVCFIIGYYVSKLTNKKK